jgi:hypothetical protein
MWQLKPAGVSLRTKNEHMKKAIVVVAVLAIVGSAVIYVLIPHRITVQQSVKVAVSQPGALRMLADSANWSKWWPWRGEGDIPMQMGQEQIDLVTQVPPVTVLDWRAKGDTITSKLDAIYLAIDSSALSWQCEVPAGNTPWSRVMGFSRAKRIATGMESLLNSMSIYLGDPVNVYGMAPQHNKVKDSVLMATRITIDHYPTTADIYALVDKLQAYIKAKGGKVVNPPMLNVLKQGPAEFRVMVGLPCDKVLAGGGGIELKRMVLGNLLTADVQAGPVRLPLLFENFEQYKSDYHFTAPAMPYQVLVTDRRAEQDTTKWITQFCYPIY